MKELVNKNSKKKLIHRTKEYQEKINETRKKKFESGEIKV